MGSLDLIYSLGKPQFINRADAHGASLTVGLQSVRQSMLRAQRYLTASIISSTLCVLNRSCSRVADWNFFSLLGWVNFWLFFKKFWISCHDFIDAKSDFLYSFLGSIIFLKEMCTIEFCNLLSQIFYVNGDRIVVFYLTIFLNQADCRAFQTEIGGSWLLFI